jgi:hypothetical protein
MAQRENHQPIGGSADGHRPVTPHLSPGTESKEGRNAPHICTLVVRTLVVRTLVVRTLVVRTLVVRTLVVRTLVVRTLVSR